MLTKLDIAALRKGDTICVHLSSNHPNGLVRVIKRAERNERNPFVVDQEHVITDAAVDIDGFGRKKRIENGAQCFGYIDLYHSQITPASSIVKTLRAGDDVTFRFWPNAHSTQYMRALPERLYGDVLYLDVRRNGKRVASWQLESRVCPDNTARMCRGFDEA